MLIRAGYDISFSVPAPTPLLLLLSIHPSRDPDLRSPHQMVFDPPLPHSHYMDGFGNICTRVTAQPGTLRIRNEFTIEDSGEPDILAPEAEQIPVEDLPDDVLVYLLGSRYCETDRLSDTAWSLFGHVPPGWARVQAICDYVHDRITFGYEHARSTRTAYEGFMERRGVCRDFAHLAVTLCRCMNIPARYCTGYLGDIGVPPVEDPMDFSAWFDVYLGGRWYTFDARHNKRRIGRILMARGRDATDVALSTSFGGAWLTGFEVITYEQEAGSVDTPVRAARG
ncbi:transglutaminase-like putative cysteine protease [Endobacter medicaginis]|uniref:Transglutaminase family protein n=1 Tax=Endobacter medicaginis TaxID=1181271 RepID=A0A850NPE1_9PROT|nr:transglutaminase family protein [Endobacter medicaginis]MBB3172516.1 transglutaminase-like putative cysteine protease [Endobacter medicaginis]MCX5473996.1 transglutaminase family protein [Endobacter medicaginis]NVN31423.1 transglutaminase family protein [Endobacter medicaginis]